MERMFKLLLCMFLIVIGLALLSGEDEEQDELSNLLGEPDHRPVP